MGSFSKLSKLLTGQSVKAEAPDLRELLRYAEKIASIENIIAVVSDLRSGTSRIFPGRLGASLGLADYFAEDSIWEKAILDLMTEEEREEKYLAELRFFHFLRHVLRAARRDYYMVSRLRVRPRNGSVMELTHRMYYIYADDSETVTHALCLYGRSAFNFPGKSIVVNSLTGVSEELTSAADESILTRREQQVLRLIDLGKTSAEIAELLSVSKNTVSRHRQGIRAKLQVKNSLEACRIAKALKII